ncbi:MAG: hypothetical protein NTX22_00230 [Ignavibacteriales bacterium]|nr:hypothetical protein [Ignavibacteriales bacterium]
MLQKIKLLIVGGCFPVQDNIEPSKLYHQQLKNKLQESNINLDIRIIRYESISKSFENIKEVIDKEKPDCLLFHLRVEPILLSSKFYSKYYDKDGNLIKHINLAVFNLNYRKIKKRTSEKVINNELSKKSKFSTSVQNIFREINYFFGYIMGDWSAAFSKYLSLLIKIIELCKTYGITLVITGPVSRPYSNLENHLSKKLHKYMSQYSFLHNQIYANLFGAKDEHGNFLFCADLKRVNEIGHKRISEIIYKIFRTSLSGS